MGDLEGFKRGLWLTIEDGQKRSRRWVGLDAILLPVADRPDWDVERFGEGFLRQAELFPHGARRDREFVMRERRVGIFAIFDGVATDVVFGCRIHLGAVDSRPLGAQLV